MPARTTRLAGPTQVVGVAVTLYTVPAGARDIIKRVILTNTGAVAMTVSVAIGAGAVAANRFLHNYPVPVGREVIIDVGAVVNDGEAVSALVGAVGGQPQCSVQLHGSRFVA